DPPRQRFRPRPKASAPAIIAPYAIAYFSPGAASRYVAPVTVQPSESQKEPETRPVRSSGANTGGGLGRPRLLVGGGAMRKVSLESILTRPRSGRMRANGPHENVGDDRAPGGGAGRRLRPGAAQAGDFRGRAPRTSFELVAREGLRRGVRSARREAGHRVAAGGDHHEPGARLGLRAPRVGDESVPSLTDRAMARIRDVRRSLQGRPAGRPAASL